MPKTLKELEALLVLATASDEAIEEAKSCWEPLKNTSDSTNAILFAAEDLIFWNPPTANWGNCTSRNRPCHGYTLRLPADFVRPTLTPDDLPDELLERLENNCKYYKDLPEIEKKLVDYFFTQGLIFWHEGDDVDIHHGFIGKPAKVKPSDATCLVHRLLRKPTPQKYRDVTLEDIGKECEFSDLRDEWEVRGRLAAITMPPTAVTYPFKNDGGAAFRVCRILDTEADQPKKEIVGTKNLVFEATCEGKNISLRVVKCPEGIYREGCYSLLQTDDFHIVRQGYRGVEDADSNVQKVNRISGDMNPEIPITGTVKNPQAWMESFRKAMAFYDQALDTGEQGDEF